MSDDDLAVLPHLRHGRLRKEWAVRARSYDRMVSQVVPPLITERHRSHLDVLDLGAGVGWLCYRFQRQGHHAVALDVRMDDVDGLSAAGRYRRHAAPMFPRVAASFDAIPFTSHSFDLAVFNASVHYALDLMVVLREAARVVRHGGRIVILDSPFYPSDVPGSQMVDEKRRLAARRFGPHAEDLLALPFIEFLTPRRLEEASRGLDLHWRRHRVRYPLWYRLRPVWAWARRRRRPSRFDVWEAAAP